jgi:hypothetical protein
MVKVIIVLLGAALCADTTFITQVRYPSKRILPEIEKGDGKAMGWTERR